MLWTALLLGGFSAKRALQNLVVTKTGKQNRAKGLTDVTSQGSVELSSNWLNNGKLSLLLGIVKQLELQEECSTVAFAIF